jgi:hypothetical protein
LKRALTILLATTLAACAARPKTPPPTPTAESAPNLRGATALVFPVQEGFVPTPDANARHWPVERAALDAEIAYWLPQAAARTTWVLPAAIDKTLARSPTLAVNPRALAVTVFQRAQVNRIGDPLFGDLYRIAATLNANIAVVPIAAEYIGASAEQAVLTIATAVIKPSDGTVIWFGVIAGKEKGMTSQSAIASAAQAFARAFADKQPGEGS